ncbi:hypothetical protein Nmel_008360, partial [Mimus melanotis]
PSLLGDPVLRGQPPFRRSAENFTKAQLLPRNRPAGFSPVPAGSGCCRAFYWWPFRFHLLLPPPRENTPPPSSSPAEKAALPLAGISGKKSERLNAPLKSAPRRKPHRSSLAAEDTPGRPPRRADSLQSFAASRRRFSPPGRGGLRRPRCCSSPAPTRYRPRPCCRRRRDGRAAAGAAAPGPGAPGARRGRGGLA